MHTIASAGQSPVSIGQLLNACATNAISRVMLGRRVVGHGGGGGDMEAEEFKAMVVELMVLAGVFNIGDFITPLKSFDLQGVVGKMKKLHLRFDAFFTSILEEHKTKGSDGSEGHVDLLSTLISLKDVDGDGGKLTDTEIKALLLVSTFFIFLFISYPSISIFIFWWFSIMCVRVFQKKVIRVRVFFEGKVTCE